MKRVAIIGTGIAGLGCAHFLHKQARVTFYEKNAHVGGHTNTATVPEAGQALAIDTGFIVFNHVTYPNLTRLFRELNVPTKPAPMSFSVQHVPSGLEYNGTSVNHLFAQRRNLLRPRFWGLLCQINRFNNDALPALQRPGADNVTVGEYVRHRRYGDDFLNLYLVPMSSAVWSTPPDKMLEFPIATLLRFFHNHGFLGLNTQHPWQTVDGGGQRYVEKLIAPFRDQIRLQRAAVRVERFNGGARVTDVTGVQEEFDDVILAGHGDESLRLLCDADEQERKTLGEFKYQPNTAILHTDASIMPRTRRAWASWNYRITPDAAGQPHPSITYWMNSLQSLPTQQNYFVSLNPGNSVRPETIVKRIQYEHPVFTLGANRAQRELHRLNERMSHVYFCGSYFRYGFHEDAFVSSLDLCRLLTGERIWS